MAQEARNHIDAENMILAAQGADPAFMPADAFGAFLGAQMPVWAKAVKDSGTKLD
jgi:hypothetical protein